MPSRVKKYNIENIGAMSYKIVGALNNSAPFDLGHTRGILIEDNTPKSPHFGPFSLNFVPYWPHFTPC